MNSIDTKNVQAFLKDSKERDIASLIPYCGRQEERAILISRLLLRMRHIYVASIRLDFH